ncbi:MAG: hypothetical protein RLO50_03515 [Azospirillaceae bacterium]
MAQEGARAAAALVKPDNRFAYRTHGGSELSGYNLLRHCGTAWAIADIANALGGLDDARSAAARAMAYIAEHRIRTIGGHACVSSGRATKLGGAGLAILAFAALEGDGRAGRFRETACSLADFILACRRDDGDFHHKLEVKSGRVLNFRSEYYTGEALFGLLALHRLTGRQDVLDVAVDSIGKLQAENYGVAQQSHWMVYAIASLHALTGERRLLDYAGAICAHIIDFPAYRERHRSTPIACRTEAFMAYADMLVRAGGAGAGPDGRAIMEATDENIWLMLRHRLNDGSFIGGDDRPEVQIDYIQHASSAFLGYYRNYDLH